MHHAIPLIGLIAAIAFAFGERVARICVGLVLVAGGALAAAVVIRIITELH